MRILLLSDRIPPENRGGAGEVLWRLAVALQAAGHEVHVVAASPDAPFEALREGIPTYHLHSRYPARWRAYLSLLNPQTARPLAALYRRLRPDVVNGHNIHLDLSYHALTLARRMGIRTVFSSHDVMPFAYHKLSHFVGPAQGLVSDPAIYRLPPLFNLRQNHLRYNPLRNLTIRRILAACDARSAVSHALAAAHRANGLPPFSVVHNGLDAAQWQTTEEQLAALRAKLGLGGRKLILFAGRLTPAKGTAQLLAAFERALPQFQHEAALFVLSASDITPDLGERFAHLRPYIVQAGWLHGAELAAAYQVAACVVAPSIIFDSFPTVLLEAAAAAKPSIATCYGGAPEIVVDGTTGYVVNPFDEATFSARLVRLINEPAHAEQLGHAAQARLAAQFPMQAQVNAMLALYQG